MVLIGMHTFNMGWHYEGFYMGLLVEVYRHFVNCLEAILEGDLGMLPQQILIDSDGFSRQ